MSPSGNTRRVSSTIRDTSLTTPSFEAKVTTSGGMGNRAVSGGRVIILSLCLFSNGAGLFSSTDAAFCLHYAIVQALARGGDRMPTPPRANAVKAPFRPRHRLCNHPRRTFASDLPVRRPLMRTAWKLVLLAAPLTALALVQPAAPAQDARKF